MASPKTGADVDVIVSEIQIAATPEQVFQALVDPSEVVKWWGQIGVYRCTDFEADLRVGGKWRSRGEGPNGSPFEVHGEIIEIDKPRLGARFSLRLELYDPKSAEVLWSDSYAHDQPVQSKQVIDVVGALDANVKAGMRQLTSDLGRYFANRPAVTAR